MNFRGRTAIVTGGAGFLGSHLVDRLLELGVDVTVVDMSNKNSRKLAHNIDRIEFIDADISDSETLEKLEPADFIFHLAAYAVPTLCEKNPDIAFKSNVLGTYNILKFALETSAKKTIFPSSALLYGKHPKYLPIDEKHPIEINSVYNTTKKFGEDLCNYFIENHKLPVVYFRLFNSFGPRQDADYFIPTVIVQALKQKKVEIWNAEPTRDFTFVADTVDAFIKAAESNFIGGPINIGSGREIEVGKIARMIAEKLGAKLVILNKPVSGSMRLSCDNSLGKKTIGWEPHIKFEDGLNASIKWFMQNKDLF
ncbi:MAG: SDR family NAD(P)-dependent oxidoreductase [Candidatus Aenigmarchaeota archaeon]|nr:SDR family NAD(P)-dependent oxidoreductase [Candidatus Aenigmarchaeota archaeon]